MGYRKYGRTNAPPFSVPLPVYSIPFLVPFPFIPEKTKTDWKKTVYGCGQNGIHPVRFHPYPEYTEVPEEHKDDILVVGVPETFTIFPLSGSSLRQASEHNPYFLALFVCALSFEEIDLHHLM
jgi:hypothetical protein